MVTRSDRGGDAEPGAADETQGPADDPGQELIYVAMTLKQGMPSEAIGCLPVYETREEALTAHPAAAVVRARITRRLVRS